MKYKLLIALALIVLIPAIFFSGYNLGALHEKGLDAPGKAVLITQAVSSYENNDEIAHKQLLSYIDTELSFYEEYLELGIPPLAVLTKHHYHMQQNESYLKYISDFIKSSNDVDLQHKKHIINRLEVIQQKSHNKSLIQAGANNAPPG